MQNNVIIGKHHLIGYVTLSDVINDIDILNEDYIMLEELIKIYLESETEENKKILEEFLTNSFIENRLSNIGYILKQLK